LSLLFWGFETPRRARPLMDAALAKALQLDDKMAEAHICLGRVRFFLDWDWTGAEGEYRRAGELDPSRGHRELADLLISQGRLQEAGPVNVLAQRFDPLNTYAIVQEADFHLLSGEYDRALEACHRARSLDPDEWYIHEEIGIILARRGKPADGIQEVETAV